MSYIILSGGVIIWPIILLSIISLAIVLEKTWNLARDIIIPKNLTEHLISLVADDSLTEKKIRKMLSEIKPDIVHIRSRWPAFCFNKIIKQHRIPLVTTYHGTYSGTNFYPKKKYNRDQVMNSYKKIMKKIHPDVSPEFTRLASIVNEAKDTVIKNIT